MADHFYKEDEQKLILFLDRLDKDIVANLSTNMAISLYDLFNSFYLDTEKFEFKIAEFFAGMPDKLALLHHVIGSISVIRTEISSHPNKEVATKIENIITHYFTEKSKKLQEGWNVAGD